MRERNLHEKNPLPSRGAGEGIFLTEVVVIRHASVRLFPGFSCCFQNLCLSKALRVCIRGLLSHGRASCQGLVAGPRGSVSCQTSCVIIRRPCHIRHKTGQRHEALRVCVRGPACQELCVTEAVIVKTNASARVLS